MYLLFTIQSPDGQPEHHNLVIEELETALYALNLYVRQGYQLSRAFLCDEGLRLQLPVEALDGTCLQKPLADLQQQWQDLLAS